MTEPLKHDERVVAARFSQDGLRIATASRSLALVWDAESGHRVAEPFRHSSVVTSLEFSLAPVRLITICADRTVRVWDLPPATNEPPEWLVELAEAMSGLALNRQVLEATRRDRAQTIKHIRQFLAQAPEDDSWAAWGRWFLANPAARSISPFSSIPIADYLDNRTKENTADSLAEAERLAFGDPQRLLRISQLRKML